MKAITHAGIATLGWAWTSRTRRSCAEKTFALTRFAHNRILSRRSHGSHVNSIAGVDGSHVNSLAGVAHKGIL